MSIDKFKGLIDFGIITMREDEFRAVLKRFPITDHIKGNRHYSISTIEINDKEAYQVALIRCIEQGNNESQDAVRDLIEDLDPTWLILVGIAGGTPEFEYSMGDVVLSSKLSDFTIEGALQNGKSEYAIGGGHVNKEIQVLLAHLPALEDKFKNWNKPESIISECPGVSYDQSNFYGDDEWNSKVLQTLKVKFDESGEPIRDPKYITGTIASSNQLIKDSDLVQSWKKLSRHLVAVEMELSGAYQAARRMEKEYPIFAIRGISDIVGFKRSPMWTEYACQIAASFARHFMKLRPITPKLFNKDQFDKFDTSSLESNLSFSSSSLILFDLDEFFESIGNFPIEGQYYSIFEQISNLSLISLQLFIITALRCYENEILIEDVTYRKKIKPIIKNLATNYRKPTFNTIITTATKCWHLVDRKAPKILRKMKDVLAKDILLSSLGDFLDDVESLFPKKEGKLKYLKKSTSKKSLIKFFFPEFAPYNRKPVDLFKRLVLENFTTNRLDIWKKALVLLREHLSPLINNEFSLQKIPNFNGLTNQYIVTTYRYNNNTVKEIKNEASIENAESLQSNITRMNIGKNQNIHLFPFLIIKDNSLYYYRRTLASGYEYYSPINNKVYIKETKKKFNHAIFKTGSKQELFWTEVIPTYNKINGIKANIPDEGLSIDFVGRHRVRKKIIEEILEIPNQNGIIYGPGGIGKTALMLQISKELFEEEDKQKILFKNIIWVSAKSDYYDHIFNSIENRKPNFKSLDNVLTAVLNFFEFENLDEYDFNDRKELVFDLLETESVILILDNFESISKSESDRIIRFFDTEVKRRLRKLPSHFKTIITSRKQIPSGFHQIELAGLDKKETKQLIRQMYANYQTTKDELTNEQQDRLYDSTRGIPVVLKHCFMQVYEHSKSFDNTIGNLPKLESEIVQFSFKEILGHIEKEDKNRIRLNILLLLEAINCPLLTRQISDILETQEFIIEKVIPSLIDLQCIKRINQRNHEKYIINDDIRLLTKALIRNHSDLVQGIRKKIIKNYDIDKQMDYSSEELIALGFFRDYLNEGKFLEAEDFINKQLKDNPNSILLNLNYAKYLLNNKREKAKAIEILEKIREHSGNHKTILFLLVESYIKLDIPNFHKANSMVIELEKSVSSNEERKLIASFYINWSFSKKNAPKKLDYLMEKVRQQRYQELAKKAISHLKLITQKDHDVYYLFSQAYFSCWDNDLATLNIDKAIELSSRSSNETYHAYYRFKNLINKKIEQYSIIRGKKKAKYSEKTK